MHGERGDGPDGIRLLRAFLIAPLAAPAGYAAGLGVMGLARVVFRSASLPSMRSVVELVLVVAAIGVPVAYAAAILGAGSVVAVLLAPQLKGELFSIPFPVWAGALLGLLCAEVFRRLLTAGGTERGGGLAG